MRVENNIIFFDNLVEAGSMPEDNSQIIQLKNIESFSQPNAKGGLYKPKSFEDLEQCAKLAASSFVEKFHQ